MLEVTVIRTDRANRAFQRHGACANGAVIFCKKLTRVQRLAFMSQHPACLVAMEACATAHCWGRETEKFGDTVRLIAPNYLKPFVKRQMNDVADAEAVVEAARLASASQQAGTGDVNLNAIAAAVIGGTSLFGGRGSAWSALLGVLVIMAISNGLTLLNLSSSLRYMITGAVLAIAVIVDSLARRSRANSGRA